jgi:muramoyltetrapeptide carboxypeptidase
MVADDLARGVTTRTAERLWALLSDAGYCWEAEVPEPVRPGRATGPLIGGCLSVLTTTLGTPYAPDTAGAILFLEDVHEFPYRLDRLLTQLKQSGKLDRVAGVVLGTFAACREMNGHQPLDVVRDFFADAPYPVGLGLPAGHDPAPVAKENLALPFGVPVAFDAERGRLTALEPAVV